jgi:hypothetical protein
VSTPEDQQSLYTECTNPPSYFPYIFSTAVTLTNVSIVDNHARCDLCSGGGLLLARGGALTMASTVIANNTAGQFGGGVFLGALGVASTCSLLAEGARLY